MATTKWTDPVSGVTHYGVDARLRRERSRTPKQDINAMRAALAIAEAEHEAAQLVKAPPNGKEKYLGNGKHRWESVMDNDGGIGHTIRLRVPGGWLYCVYGCENDNTVFVPLPAAIGYAV